MYLYYTHARTLSYQLALNINYYIIISIWTWVGDAAAADAAVYPRKTRLPPSDYSNTRAHNNILTWHAGSWNRAKIVVDNEIGAHIRG